MYSLLRTGLAIFLISNCIPLSAQETVRIAIGEWPPYLSQELPHNGVAAHLVKEAFEAGGVDVAFEYYPWQRVRVYVENGTQDASILWVRTEERAQSLLFSDVLLEGEAVFFYNKNDPLIWQDYEDLDGKRFGGLLSASYPWFEAAKARGVDVEMELVTVEHRNFSKLLSKRIDAFSLDKLVGLHMLQQRFPDQADRIGYDPSPIESWPYRLIFTRSPRGEALMKRFNEGLAIIKERGLIPVYINNVANGVYLPPEPNR
ncbi:substrate-binding periplasmic protein [Saccharospirillum salsuginis]|uniref:ABC transporter substrate-binding protein n=1 Tax=Saccharospirillum salsuginis TaxID=418750 RepID=A0A918NB25_9GAMM|nr:transporter substrate-binding domain-containing protein [Saccharospirillum salsuginis]GGX54979.1 ABC transporter substrate-binding protein [Saccharospirillum salsuginis]